MGERKTNGMTKLNDVLRGMCVKNWEKRENSDGKTVVYVRYVERID